VIKDTKLHANVENLTVVGLNVDIIVAANGATGTGRQKYHQEDSHRHCDDGGPGEARIRRELRSPRRQHHGAQSSNASVFSSIRGSSSKPSPTRRFSSTPPVARSTRDQNEFAETTARAECRAWTDSRGPTPRGDRRSFAATAEEADGVLVVGGTMVFANRAELTRQALKLRLMCNVRDDPDVGCVMSYGMSLAELCRRAAVLVDKILKRAMPAELPIEQPKTFEFVVNLKTANARRDHFAERARDSR
jgi:hypothetical protein